MANAVRANHKDYDILVIGAGIAGIASAYFIKKHHSQLKVGLIDRGAPMAFTSAQSGENYRDWWPHPTMRTFISHSLDLMDDLNGQTAGRLGLNHSGYLLASRETNIDKFLCRLAIDENTAQIHRHSGSSYQPEPDADRRGIDIVSGRGNIQRHYPALANDIETLVHIRRAGTLDSQQMGMAMLEEYRNIGGQFLRGTVTDIITGPPFRLTIATHDILQTDRLILAGGPYLDSLARILGVDLPVKNLIQQKIAFEDHEGAVPRNLPFTIDMDDHSLEWDSETREALLDDPDWSWVTESMVGGVHCRPDGGPHSRWIRLGWAYNAKASAVRDDPHLDSMFPDLVLRRASQLIPKLSRYIGHLPRACVHYGGYYTMTKENWPLIGPLGIPGAYMVGALSGFGTMAAMGAGDLVAKWVMGDNRPGWTEALSLSRYDDPPLLDEIRGTSRGLL